MEASEVYQETESTKIKICTQGLNSGFASSLSSFKKDKQAQG